MNKLVKGRLVMGIMTLREVMDRSVDILRKYFKTTLLFTFGYGAIGMMAAIVLIILGSIAAAISFAFFNNTMIFAVFVTVIVLIVVAFYLSMSIGMIKIAAQEFSEEKVLAHNAIGAAFKSLHKVLGILVCALLLFIPVIAIFAAVIYLLYKGFLGSLVLSQIYRTKEILLIISSILTVLAAFFAIMAYSTVFMFSLHAVIIENKGVIASLGRSYALVKNNFWKMFGCTILFSLAVYGIRTSLEGFIGVIAGVIYLVLKVLDLNQDFMTFITMTASLINWPLMLISWILIVPISTHMVSLLYFNQRFKKEGYDLELKLMEIQKNVERKQLGELV
jgi:hypothetical protein